MQCRAGKARRAEALLRIGIGALLTGDVETGKAVLRVCIKATRLFSVCAAVKDVDTEIIVLCATPRSQPKGCARSP